MYTWAVGSQAVPGEFSGTACGGARDRREAMRRILKAAPDYNVLGPNGFATIQQNKGKGVVGNPTWYVLEEVRSILREKAEKSARKRARS